MWVGWSERDQKGSPTYSRIFEETMWRFHLGAASGQSCSCSKCFHLPPRACVAQVEGVSNAWTIRTIRVWTMHAVCTNTPSTDVKCSLTISCMFIHITFWSFRHVYVSHCSSSGGFEISRENSCFEPNRVAPPLPRLGAVSIWSWNLVCPRESWSMRFQ